MAKVLIASTPAPKFAPSGPPRFSASKRRLPWGLTKCSTKSETRSWSMRTPTRKSAILARLVTRMVELVVASSSKINPLVAEEKYVTYGPGMAVREIRTRKFTVTTVAFEL